MKRAWLLLSVCIAVTGIAAVCGYFAWPGLLQLVRSSPMHADSHVFSLEDSRGKTVSETAFAGRWLVVYFGFAGCSNTCPTALHTLSAALDGLGPQGADVQVAFVSIDANDTAPALKEFLRPFGARFSGLTGTQEQIDAAKSAFRVFAQRLEQSSEGTSGFLHSNAYYVLDPAGHFRRQISADSSATDLGTALRRAIGSGTN